MIVARMIRILIGNFFTFLLLGCRGGTPKCSGYLWKKFVIFLLLFLFGGGRVALYGSDSNKDCSDPYQNVSYTYLHVHLFTGINFTFIGNKS